MKMKMKITTTTTTTLLPHCPATPTEAELSLCENVTHKGGRTRTYAHTVLDSSPDGRLTIQAIKITEYIFLPDFLHLNCEPHVSYLGSECFI